MIEQVPWWAPLVAYGTGWLMGRLDRDTQDDWRRRFNHENRRGPVGPPPLRLRRSKPVRFTDPRLGVSWDHSHDSLAYSFDPGSTIRGNGHGGPTTPKPEIVPCGQGLRSDPSKWQRLLWDEPSGFEPDPPLPRLAQERRGSNPPPPGLKPEPPAGPPTKPQFPSPREIPGDMPFYP